MNKDSKITLTHLNEVGEACMVDVSDKPISHRKAIARGKILLQSSTLQCIHEKGMPKGDVLAVARIAGIQAAKRTAELIPLCHSLPISKVTVDFQLLEDGIEITATVKTTAQTGVEMEALTAVSVAALTLYDMCKAVDKHMIIEKIELLHKEKHV
jgi:cyclic pyranopterin monophosphate synthase